MRKAEQQSQIENIPNKCSIKVVRDDQAITIGITCFNEGDWLLECPDSALTPGRPDATSF